MESILWRKLVRSRTQAQAYWVSMEHSCHLLQVCQPMSQEHWRSEQVFPLHLLLTQVETSRATVTESSLAFNLANERSRALLAESTLNAAVSSVVQSSAAGEAQRAQTVEGSLSIALAI